MYDIKGGYTIFYYFPTILHQTMGEQVMLPHKNTTEHAQDTGRAH